MAPAKHKRLAVIGGGAKGVALAAKASAIAHITGQKAEVVIFEKRQIGAHWRGASGYTDGEQDLCTSPMRDLGFPYLGQAHAPHAVQDYFHANYSWAAYKITRGDYRDWINRGSPRCSHTEFADYLEWVAGKCSADVRTGEVTALQPVGAQWSLTVKAPAAAPAHGLFDGVVVTGPGPARYARAKRHKRIFDGADFWQRSSDIHAALRNALDDDEIVIVGGGGTAAAIIAWLVRNNYKHHPIRIVASQATLFTRGDSSFEENLFSDETGWLALSPASKKAFADRLNRGVVWRAVMPYVEKADLRFVDRRYVEIIDKPGAGGKAAQVSVIGEDWNGRREPFDGVIAINALGFDNWWFLNQLPKTAYPHGVSEGERNTLKEGMNKSLAFESGWSLPPLHAPFLSEKFGPGFGALLALGDMSDRILATYL